MKVGVSGAGGQTFETEAGADGEFAVKLPRGGPYNVRAVVPFSAAAMSHTTPLKADAAGNFTLTVYGDFEYEVSASAYGMRNGRSGKVKVSASGDRLRLVLKPD